MESTNRFRRILTASVTAGALAATMFLSAPALSATAALPGPGDLQIDPCAVVTHGCAPQAPDDKAPVPQDEGDPTPHGGPGDFTNPTVDPDPDPQPEDPTTTVDADQLGDIAVASPHFTG